jgi:Mrp family chromosome partitioning ATPase
LVNSPDERRETPYRQSEKAKMGRIAEALKKAQQERAARIDEEARAAETAAGSPFTAGPAGDDVAAEPPAPRPFLLDAVALVQPEIDRQVLTLHDPGSPMAEKFRSLRTRLLTGNPTGGSRTYAVTSSLPREGKTVTCANLAFSLAELKHLRIAVVDGDLRGQGLSRMMGTADRPGLCEVLRGEKQLSDVCLPAVRSNLYMIPIGHPGTAGPSELLVGTRAISVFREIAERFHYGLIDTPAATTVADIGLVAPLCHSVLLVARMNTTPEPVLRRCINMLQANQVTITGCVLTGCAEEEAYCG